MMKGLLFIVLAAMIAFLPVSVARAGTLTVDVPKTTLTVTKVGDIELKLVEGEDIEFSVDGRAYTGKGIEVLINGISYMADLYLVSNLESTEGDGLTADHDGTIGLGIGGDMLDLEYDGGAKIYKDMVKHTKIIKSHGDLKVTDGTGLFADLKGVEGSYMLKIVEYGKAVGSQTGFWFSGMEVLDIEDVEDID